MPYKDNNVVFQQWIKDEFNQSYEQIRDRDRLIIELLKFYFGLILSVLTASIGIYEIKFINNKVLWISLLLIISGVIGIFVSLCLLTIREHFVTAARQLNAIRNYATKHLSDKDKEKYVIQGIDSKIPSYWYLKSYHSIVIIAQILITIIAIISGVCGLLFFK